MRLFTIVLALSTVFSVSAATAREARSDGVLFVTPSQLNNNPAQYNGKLVRVLGYTALGFEKSCLTEARHSYGTNRSSSGFVTLVSQGHLFHAGQKYDDKPVMVQGVFKRDFFDAPIGGRIITRNNACNRSVIDVSDQADA